MGPSVNSVVVTADVHSEPVVRVTTPAGSKITPTVYLFKIPTKPSSNLILRNRIIQQYTALKKFILMQIAMLLILLCVIFRVQLIVVQQIFVVCQLAVPHTAPLTLLTPTLRATCWTSRVARVAWLAVPISAPITLLWACMLARGVVSDTAHAVAGAKAGGDALVTAGAVGTLHSDKAYDTADSANTVFTVQSPQSTVRVNQTQNVTPSLDANSITITEADIQQAQAADDCISPVIKLLLAGNTPPTGFKFRQYPEESRVLLSQWETLVIENNILYRRFCHPNGTTHLQFVLPAVLRQRYCDTLHADIGHGGQKKTFLAFSSRAYFPAWQSYLRLLLTALFVV